MEPAVIAASITLIAAVRIGLARAAYEAARAHLIIAVCAMLIDRRGCKLAARKIRRATASRYRKFARKYWGEVPAWIAAVR